MPKREVDPRQRNASKARTQILISRIRNGYSHAENLATVERWESRVGKTPILEQSRAVQAELNEKYGVEDENREEVTNQSFQNVVEMIAVRKLVEGVSEESADVAVAAEDTKDYIQKAVKIVRDYEVVKEVTFEKQVSSERVDMKVVLDDNREITVIVVSGREYANYRRSIVLELNIDSGAVSQVLRNNNTIVMNVTDQRYPNIEQNFSFFLSKLL